jgi:hypothetical protein
MKVTLKVVKDVTVFEESKKGLRVVVVQMQIQMSAKKNEEIEELSTMTNETMAILLQVMDAEQTV